MEIIKNQAEVTQYPDLKNYYQYIRRLPRDSGFPPFYSRSLEEPSRTRSLGIPRKTVKSLALPPYTLDISGVVSGPSHIVARCCSLLLTAADTSGQPSVTELQVTVQVTALLSSVTSSRVTCYMLPQGLVAEYKLRVHKLRFHKLHLYKLRVYKLRVYKLRVYKSRVYKLRVYKLRVYKSRVYKSRVYKLGEICLRHCSST